jgi:hypothetical protein
VAEIEKSYSSDRFVGLKTELIYLLDWDFRLC